MMQRKHYIWLCLLAVLQCDAAIYQWTDGTGAVQFSDRPPTEQVDVIERTDIETSATSAPSAPLPQNAAALVEKRIDSLRKPRVARTSEREQARRHCDKIRQRITVTQNKLRAGYSARRGIQLTERLRADRDILHHECRY